MKVVEVPRTQRFNTESTEKERKKEKGQKELQRSDDDKRPREEKSYRNEGAKDAGEDGVPDAGGVGSACRDLAGMAA